MPSIVFKREQDVESLYRRLNNGKIKIIAGLRRAGKSYLLNPLFKNRLMEKNGAREENFEIKDFSRQDKVTTDDALKTYLDSLTERKELRYIFLDEVQESGEHFAKIILRFHRMHPEYEIYLTGSNSKILSDDITNHFKDDGDPYFIESLPYSEIIKSLPDFTLDDYFKVGGLPSVLVQENRQDELRNLYKNLYLTDIENRLKKSNQLTKFSAIEAENIIRSICSNITSPMSLSSLSKNCLGRGRVSGSEERNAASRDCLSVLHEAENSYLLYRYIYPHANPEENNPNAFERHDIKYYCYDIGILNEIVKPSNIKGAVLENAVFLELHRRKIEAVPYIERDKDGNETKNIDFCFEYGGRNILFQVTHDINPKNERREVTNLLDIQKPYDKYIVYVNTLLEEEKGITYLTAKRFFTEFL